MIDSIKDLYIALLTEDNITIHLAQPSSSTIILEEIYIVGQTIALSTTEYKMDNSLSHIHTDIMEDWAENEGKVLKRLNELEG